MLLGASVCLSGIIVANQVQAGTPRALHIGVGNFPPFFIKENQTGVFWDLVKEVFEQLPQYTITYQSMSNKRLVAEISERKLDGAANITNGTETGGYASIPIFRYLSFATTKNLGRSKIWKN